MKIKILFSQSDLQTIKMLKDSTSTPCGKEMSDEDIVRALLESMLEIGVNFISIDKEGENCEKLYEVVLVENSDNESGVR